MQHRMRMLSDASTPDDLLNFKRYVAPLLQIMTDISTETPFAIGIFGPWGTGKSTLMEYLETKLDLCPDVGFFQVKFNPWMYRDEKNLIVPLLHTLQDFLAEKPGKEFFESAKRIGTVLARIGASLLLKTASAGQVSMEELEKQEQAYLDRQHIVKSEIRNLKSELQAIIDGITKGSKSREGVLDNRVVFFIDDLDRCEPDQIVSLLEGLKLFLDLKGCFFVIALDEEIVHQAIRIKYSKFEFVGAERQQVGQRYLEKMIQLPLYLYPLSREDVETYLKGLPLPLEVMEKVGLFAGIMLPNPRKIKRILNLFSFNLAILGTNASIAGQIQSVDIMGRLITVQVQDYDLYKAILENPELPLYLGEVYRGTKKVSDQPAWANLREKRADILALCTKYFRPGTWIQKVFEPQDAFPGPDKLQVYLNMLGRGHSG